MGLSAFKSVGADLRAAFQAEVLTILARIEMARRNNSPQCAAIRKEIDGRQRVRAARDMTGAVNQHAANMAGDGRSILCVLNTEAMDFIKSHVDLGRFLDDEPLQLRQATEIDGPVQPAKE